MRGDRDNNAQGKLAIVQCLRERSAIFCLVRRMLLTGAGLEVGKLQGNALSSDVQQLARIR